MSDSYIIIVETKFSFTEVSITDIELEVRDLKTKKATTFVNIPTKILKQAIKVIVEPLMQIWNNEIISNKNFPTKLKYADLSPIFKRLESILVKNYRPVSLLPVVSKFFERIMQKQVNAYVEKYLSPFLCGYRK